MSINSASRPAPSHAFVVPAYGFSEYLEPCLQSLGAQLSASQLVVATSTPHPSVEALAAKYGARLHVHSPNRGIGADWNAALECAGTDLVTLAHQDDTYSPSFSQCVVAAFQKFPHAPMAFTDAVEATAAGVERHGRNNRIKRILTASAFCGRQAIQGPLAKRILLGLGNAINCPTVTINRRQVPEFRFREDLRTNIDWLGWIELASRGPIVRVAQPLMHHRVHDDSETARCLADGARKREDLLVFQQLWPQPVAGLLAWLYNSSYSGYSG